MDSGAQMGKKKLTSVAVKDVTVDEDTLFTRVAEIIEGRKNRAMIHANQETTMMFWEVGHYINSIVLGDKRAEYGKRIVATLSPQLVERYGRSFSYDNLRRMMRFAENFNDLKIVAMLSPRLSWSHIIEILPLKSTEAQLYYANEVAQRNLGVHELRRQISRRAYERREIANAEIPEGSPVPFNIFKDPYLLDMFGLKDNYSEADLEKAILTDLEAFILEFGRGFTFIERQKRMIIGGEDVVLDLLFYHRIMKRLVAVELKVGKFMAAYKGQMELYLGWLDRYERQEGEEAPIGIILCTSANRDKMEMLNMDKSGIAVAEYWTYMPPKAEFEKKIRMMMMEAKERLERRRSLPKEVSKRQIDYFYETK